jgi:hypothetical protein
LTTETEFPICSALSSLGEVFPPRRAFDPVFDIVDRNTSRGDHPVGDKAAHPEDGFPLGMGQIVRDPRRGGSQTRPGSDRGRTSPNPAFTAGHGLHRSFLRPAQGGSETRPFIRVHLRSSAAESTARWISDSPLGMGVHRSISTTRVGAGLRPVSDPPWIGRGRTSPKPAFTAGHGLHRSFSRPARAGLRPAPISSASITVHLRLKAPPRLISASPLGMGCIAHFRDFPYGPVDRVTTARRGR